MNQHIYHICAVIASKAIVRKLISEVESRIEFTKNRGERGCVGGGERLQRLAKLLEVMNRAGKLWSCTA